ncbi:MAG TPA: hypothetical protein VGP36_20470 [Mycobacteriales bacterium]|nr:hypothetical protein [Mycobacteriales bacterium]
MTGAPARKRALVAVLVGAALAGCGVKAQGEPEILRSPPAAPTATPSATERPTATDRPTPTSSSVLRPAPATP